MNASKSVVPVQRWYSEDLHQDRREREQACPRVLPGVRNPDLRHLSWSSSVNLWAAGRWHRPTSAVCSTGPSNLVPFGAALVDGLTGYRESGAGVTAEPLV